MIAQTFWPKKSCPPKNQIRLKWVQIEAETVDPAADAHDYELTGTTWPNSLSGAGKLWKVLFLGHRADLKTWFLAFQKKVPRKFVAS